MMQLARAFLFVAVGAVAGTVVAAATVARVRVRRPRPPSLFNTPGLIPVILLVLSFGSGTQASDFSALGGVVTDSLLSEPVGGASVTVLPDGYSTITTFEGRFQFDRLTPGFKRLLVSSSFHHSQESSSFLVRAGERLEFSVTLIPLLKIEAPQTVIAERDQIPGRVIYQLPELQRSGANDVGEFLQSRGVFVQTDGRTQFASLRGAQPNTILVLVDGTALNPDGSAVDLSSIPLETVERVEVYKSGAAAQFGADALGGAVNLISRGSSVNDALIEAGGRVGSFGLRGGGVALATHSTLVGGMLYYDYEEADNDYQYEHPHLGELNRANDASRRYSLYSNFTTTSLPELTLSLRLAGSHLGIPGAVFQETGRGAGAKHHSRLVSLSYQRTDWLLRSSYHDSEQEYVDPSAFIPYDNQYHQIARDVEVQWSKRVSDWLRLESGAMYASETYFNANLANVDQSLPEVSRRYQSLRGGATLEQRVFGLVAQLSQLYRWDNIDDDSRISPYLGASIHHGNRLRIGASTAYSESYRRPPIDALFWQGDVFAVGNPDLRAETGIQREAALSIELKTPLAVALQHTWFETDLEDLIVWRRQFDGKYKPVNLSRSHNSGTETSLRILAFAEKLELDYSRHTLTATNLSVESGYYGNLIPFRPDRVESFTARVNLAPVTVRYRLSYTGERYIREANTKAQPSFTLHDLKLELNVKAFDRVHVVSLEVLNLLDERYELLERMPMPPRSFRFEFEINI